MMTDRIAYNTETKRRLEYTRRILKSIHYDSPDDREDIPSILRKYQEEIIKEFTDRVVERLESNMEKCKSNYAISGSDYSQGKIIAYARALGIVRRGVQNE